jgi:hypothetical protein
MTNHPDFDLEGLPSTEGSVLAYRLLIPRDHSRLYRKLRLAAYVMVELFLYGLVVNWLKRNGPQEKAVTMVTDILIPYVGIFPLLVLLGLTLKAPTTPWKNERLPRLCGAKR